MSTTFADPPRRSRHLAAVGGRHAATGKPLAEPAPARSVLNRPGALTLARADQFIDTLDSQMAGTDPIRAAVLLGQARLHLEELSDLVRVLATVTL